MPSHLSKNAVIVAALVGAGFFLAWLRFRPYLGDEGRFTDGTRQFDVDSAEEVRYAVWDAPELLPGEVNSTAAESRPALSPDGRLVVFAVGERGLGADLWVVDGAGERASAPRPLAALNTAADELAPAFSHGWLWFASDRRGSAGGLDLWRAPYRDGIFGDAERIGGGLNSSADDTDPAPLLGGGELAFASNRARGARTDFDLWIARRAPDGATWEIAALEELNGPFDDREPAWTRDGRTLFFASDRDGGPGGFDILRAGAVPLADGGRRFADPERATGINGAGDERGPAPADDGFTLLFAAGTGGKSDLFRARSLELFRTSGRPVGWLELAVLAALVLLAILAWLAKRWEQLEVVYKCFLVSVVVHLVLMAWMRGVYPEPGTHELAREGQRVRVRLVADEHAERARLERGGRLEVARRAPDEAELTREHRTAARADRTARPEPRLVARGELPAQLEAPARAASAPVLDSRALERARPPVAVAVPEESFERLAGREPAWVLAPPEPSSATPRTRADSGPPSAEFRRDALGMPERAAPAPRELAFDVPTAPPETTPLARLAPPTPEPRDPEGRAPVELAGPPEPGREGVVESRAPPAEEALALDAPRSFTRESPSASGERAAPRRLAATAPPADARPSPSPLSTPSSPPRDERDAIVLAPKRWEHTPYRSRVGEEKLRALEAFGGTRETEAAVAAGLAYLARTQAEDGFWGSAGDRHEKYGHVAVGKTGLALLAFLGAGHTQSETGEYRDVVARALAFLLAVQDEGSGHFGDSSSYSHGIATYAIAECYALTADATLRAPLERAVAHVLAHQETSSDPRFHGGWGYYYPDERVFDRWPRASITAWQVMALESARLGGLEVPRAAFDGARAFLAAAWDAGRGAYRYSHDPDRLRSAYAVLPGSTPAALFALSLLGEDVASGAYGPARVFVSERAPERYAASSDDDFVHHAAGNLYFWYYGTLALFRVGGAEWEAWNRALQDTLLPAQQSDGSWLPISVYAREYAGDDDGDRSYATAVCVLTLEIYYRYFTPLLEVE